MADDAEDLVRAGLQPRHGWLVRSARRAVWLLVRAWFFHEHDRVSALQHQVRDLAGELSSVRARTDEDEGGAKRMLADFEQALGRCLSQLAVIEAARRQDHAKVATIEAACNDVASRIARVEEALQAEVSLLRTSHQTSSQHTEVRLAPIEQMVHSATYDVAVLRDTINGHLRRLEALDIETKATVHEWSRMERSFKVETTALSNVVSRFRDLVEDHISGEQRDTGSAMDRSR